MIVPTRSDKKIALSAQAEADYQAWVAAGGVVIQVPQGTTVNSLQTMSEHNEQTYRVRQIQFGDGVEDLARSASKKKKVLPGSR